MADCLATNKACHSRCVSAGLGTSRMDGCTLRPASRWSEMFAHNLLSFPTRLLCFVPRVLLEGCCCLPARAEKAVSGCPHLKSLVRSRCGGWQPYQVSRQRLSRPRKCRGTSGHPAGHFSRQIRVTACSGDEEWSQEKGAVFGQVQGRW